MSGLNDSIRATSAAADFADQPMGRVIMGNGDIGLGDENRTVLMAHQEAGK